jgi:hypothetical protein
VGGSARSGAPLSLVEMVLLLGSMHHAAAEAHAKKPVVIRFEQVNRPKLVELIVPRFFSIITETICFHRSIGRP